MKIVINKNNLFSFNSIVVLALLFLGALNFLGRHSIWFLLAFIFMLMVQRVKVKLNAAVVFLFLFSVFYMLFSDSVSIGVVGLVTLFIYMMCYITGYNLVDNIDTIEIRERKFNIILLVLMAGNFMHFLLNLLINYNQITSRNTLDFWTRQVMSATGQSVLACLAIAIGCAFVLSDCNTKYKVIACVILGLVIYYNLILAGRTIFVMLIILLTVAYGNYLINGTVKKNKIRKFIGLILFVLLLYFAYEQNIMGLKTIVEHSNFYNRFWNPYASEHIMDDSRMSVKAEYVKRFLEHPWGGNFLKDEIGKYAHDLLLDIYDDAGIFAFIAMTGYVLSTMMNLFRVMRSKYTSFLTKQLVLCVYVAIYIEFFLEPIIAGMPWILTEFCLIDGVVFHMLRKAKRNGGVRYADCSN